MTAFHRKLRHVSYVADNGCIGGLLLLATGASTTIRRLSPIKKRDMPTRRELANAIRALSMDAVQKANSGHPGAPMGMADIAEVLWRDVLKFNPGNPTWMDRDRFVLSNGHASMLLYSLLHLTGYPLSMEEIKNFRQFGSKTAGHPERETHLGIETTTGPLGQGVANAVGMALAERTLAATFNRPGHTIIDHHTYVFLGDGCMMEGISHEIASFAGMQKLGKLILVYDDNGISIDGKVAGWFRDDTAKRFEAYGWHVLPHVDGQNSDAVAAALAAARAETGRPSLICAKTVIGWGAPNKQGSASMHGEAMGNEEVAATRSTLGGRRRPSRYPPTFAPPGTCARRARVSKANGGPGSRPTKMNFPHWPRNSSAGWRATCPAISAISSTPTSRACSPRESRSPAVSLRRPR